VLGVFISQLFEEQDGAAHSVDFTPGSYKDVGERALEAGNFVDD
jgi:hypothetical protein